MEEEEMITAGKSQQCNHPVTSEDELRRQREEAESIELARALMAEEAMASYEQHFMIIRDDNMSDEDRAVWQAAMREEERDEAANALEGHGDADGEISYETMLELGERIGDVKTERWTMVAKKEIRKLPKFSYNDSVMSKSAATDKDASELRCLVCQCEYENGDLCCRLPCRHVFHLEGCIDQWLLTRDFCPYCRQCIVQGETPPGS